MAKNNRTRLDNLSARARVLDGDDLANVSGGLRNLGGAVGGLGQAAAATSYTLTEPNGPDDIYHKDDE